MCVASQGCRRRGSCVFLFFFVLRCIDTAAHTYKKIKIIIICTLTGGGGTLTSDLTTGAAAEYGVPIHNIHYTYIYIYMCVCT